MTIFFTAVILLFVSTTLLAQKQKPKSETRGQPAGPPEAVVIAPFEALPSQPQAVPDISLPRALKFAEKYLKKERATGSQLHLIRAEFVFVGDKKNPAPSWHLRWRRKGSTSLRGYDAELYVFMNGRIWDPPGM